MGFDDDDDDDDDLTMILIISKIAWLLLHLKLSLFGNVTKTNDFKSEDHFLCLNIAVHAP